MTITHGSASIRPKIWRALSAALLLSACTAGALDDHVFACVGDADCGDGMVCDPCTRTCAAPGTVAQCSDGAASTETSGDTTDVVLSCPPCPASPSSCIEIGCNTGTGKCEATYVAPGTPCDDGNACTGGDSCGNGKCQGTAIPCDEHDACTADTCSVPDG